MDAVGQSLLQKIQELVKTRTDITKADFFRAIGRPTPSWGSEFWSGKRTTNDLRLVIKIARFFKVPIGYLLNEPGAPRDALTVSLLGVMEGLTDPRDREAVLQLALTIQRRAAGGSESGGPPSGPPDRGGRNSGGSNALQRGRRR